MATLADQIIAYATQEIGKPYVFGDEGPDSFDCSGLMQYTFGKAGLKLPRIAAEQQKFASPISADQARPGDLVFWGAPAHHVALYIGGGRIISAPKPGAKVHITNLYGNHTFGRVSGVFGTVSNIVNTALTPVVWGVDSIRQTVGEVGLLVVFCLGGASLIGLGAWQAVKGQK